MTGNSVDCEKDNVSGYSAKEYNAKNAERKIML